MKADFYKIKEGKKETVTLPEEIFGVEWNPDLVHQTIVSMQSNKRNKVAHTKDRSDVRGGGKKPWRQKGTGRARHGSIRSPLWIGGGVTFGPRKEKNYKKKINKKVMLKALFSTLSKKNEDTEILFVDSCDFEKPNVKEAKSFIEALEKSSGVNILSKKKNSAVIFSPEKSVNVWKSFNNFANIKTEETRNINPLHLLEKKYIIFINPKDTIDFLQSKNEKIKSVKSEKIPSNEATSSNEARKETKKSAKKPEKTAKTKKTVTKTTKKASSAKAKDKKE